MIGKTIVISYLPNFDKMKFPEASVFLIRNEANVIDEILNAYHNNSDELARIRIEFAKSNTWDHRIKTFLHIFTNTFRINCDSYILSLFTPDKMVFKCQFIGYIS